MTLFSISTRSFFPSRQALAAAALCCLFAAAAAQAPPQTTPPAIQPTTTTLTNPDGTTTTTTTTVDATGKLSTSSTTMKTFGRGKKKNDPKTEKTQLSKDSKKEAVRDRRAQALIGADSRLPDKQLYDKALEALKHGRFDVARLDLQTMLNTYPDSQYQMRAKLAIADSWYKEGGTAALTQAESEYADFRIFFPNVPEAAEAQMRIGDIYFRQMDKPDRDFTKSLHAEEEYRRMLTDYPDSVLVPQAKQRLREVQEVLAARESDIASYYATRENWPAVEARYRTVADSYPLYSHLDDVLIGLGDAYEAQARLIRNRRDLPEGGRAQILKLLDNQAAECYRKVVLEHSAAPHVEDARDRLAAMNLPIPEPSPEQVAASVALENSRSQYTVANRAVVLFMHTPDVVSAARLGEPTMVDPRATTAPMVAKKITDEFNEAFAPPGAHTAATDAPAASTAPAVATAPAAATTPSAPLAFQEVSNGAADGSAPAADLTATPPPARSGSTGSSIGVEILTPAARPGNLPAATGTPDPNFGLRPVGNTGTTFLPPVEKPTVAPDQPNEIHTATPAAQTPAATGKTAKPAFNKKDESSSKHPKKKGLKKIVEPL